MKTCFIKIICLCAAFLVGTSNLFAIVLAPCHDVYVKGKCVNGVEAKNCKWLKIRQNEIGILLNDSFTDSSIPGFGSTSFWSHSDTVIDAGIMYLLDGTYYYAYGQKVSVGNGARNIDVENGNVAIGYGSFFVRGAYEEYKSPYRVIGIDYSSERIYYNTPHYTLNGKYQALPNPQGDYIYNGYIQDITIENNTVYAIVHLNYKNKAGYPYGGEFINEQYIWTGKQYITLEAGAQYYGMCSLGGAIYVCGTHKEGTLNKACYWRLLRNSSGQLTGTRIDLLSGIEAYDILAVPCK